MDPEKELPDGAVDWDAANPLQHAAALTDTEGTDPGDGAAFAPRQFKYRGQTLTAHSAEDATAIEALIQKNRSQNGRLGTENATLRERLARLEGRVDATAAPPPEALPAPMPPSIELARIDPDRWQADLIAYHAQQNQRMRLEIEESVRVEFAKKDSAAAENAAAQAWGEGFYARHAHLNTPRRRAIVQSEYKANARAITRYADDVEGAYEHLAELADAAIAELAGTTDGLSRSTTRPPRLEGPSARSGTRAPEPERPQVTGATWLAKERARMRGDPIGGKA